MGRGIRPVSRTIARSRLSSNSLPREDAGYMYTVVIAPFPLHEKWKKVKALAATKNGQLNMFYDVQSLNT